MQTKLFELRDRGTFVPVICTLMVSGDEKEHYLLRRSGYGPSPELILMAGLVSSPDQCTYDMYDWGGNRTRMFAHQYIQEHWHELVSGDVIDVEYIQGETTTPKQSERITAPL